MQSDSHLWLRAGPQKDVVDQVTRARPKGQPRAKRKHRRPGWFLERHHSPGTNQADSGPQDKNGIGKKHQNETADGSIKGLTADDVVDVCVKETHVAKSRCIYSSVGARNRVCVAFDANYLT